MKGKELHRIIKNSPIKLKEVYEKTDLVKGTLYNYLNKEDEDVDLSIIDKLIEGGIDVYGLAKKLGIEIDGQNKDEKNIDYEKEIIQILKEQNAELKNRVKELDLLNKQTAYNIPTLIDEMKRMSGQIESLNGVTHLIKEALEINTVKKK